MKLKRTLTASVALALAAAACTASPSGNGDQAAAAGNDSSEAATEESTPTTLPCDFAPNPLILSEAPPVTPAGLIALSQSVFDCVETVVIAQTTDVADARFAAETAVDANAPLLLVDGAGDLGPVVEEIGRLRAENVITVGVGIGVTARLNEALQSSIGLLARELTPPTLPPSTTTTAPLETTAETTTGAASDPGGSNPEDSAPESTPTTLDQSETTTGGESEDPDAAAASEDTAPAASIPTTTTTAFTPVAGAPAPEPGGPLVLFAEDAALDAYLATPVLVAGGGEAIAMPLADVDALRRTINGRTNVLAPAGSTPTQAWQVALAASDTELFGGGTRVFPDRRIVAYYGNPLTFRLGLLGETDPERAVERVVERAALYEAEGLPPVIPGFEIIATVAATQAGDDGNFSNEMEVEVLRPWIDTAMANGVSVILDLQPGRTDFLTQAKIYEEFLRLPNVGLALDPEWRLKPDQRHLRQIGGVSAEEVNAVTDYLATLVREENLPQKVLVLHQFQIRMLPDRELIKTIPEVATVVHVDGQGSLGSKYGTWDAMLNAPTAPDQDLWWAWKNFIDEDIPTARPGQVNAVEPLPVIVTYQ